MKKQILMMALCVSTLMPVTVFGEEAAVQNVSTVNKEETASGDENPKIEESEVTAVNDTVTVAIDATMEILPPATATPSHTRMPRLARDISSTPTNAMEILFQVLRESQSWLPSRMIWMHLQVCCGRA